MRDIWNTDESSNATGRYFLQCSVHWRLLPKTSLRSDVNNCTGNQIASAEARHSQPGRCACRNARSVEVFSYSYASL